MLRNFKCKLPADKNITAGGVNLLLSIITKIFEFAFIISYGLFLQGFLFIVHY